MHYYTHNIADYRKDTGHLTMLEHGIYRALIDWYYLDEEPIPRETQVVIRRLRLGSESDIAALKNVLSDFFELHEDGYHQSRCDQELKVYKQKAARNKVNGKRGGRPKKTQVVISGNPELSDQEPTRNPNKRPTNNQEPITNKPPISPKGDRFAEFWSVWPSSTRKVGKATCEAKWKRGKLDDIADRILIHVRAMKQTEQWKTGYEPAPATYLNQKRWEDDLPTLEGSGKPAWMTGML